MFKHCGSSMHSVSFKIMSAFLVWSQCFRVKSHNFIWIYKTITFSHRKLAILWALPFSLLDKLSWVSIKYLSESLLSSEKLIFDMLVFEAKNLPPCKLAKLDLELLPFEALNSCMRTPLLESFALQCSDGSWDFSKTISESAIDDGSPLYLLSIDSLISSINVLFMSLFRLHGIRSNSIHELWYWTF